MLARVRKVASSPPELAAEHAGDDVELLVDVPGVGLDEDGADGGGEVSESP